MCGTETNNNNKNYVRTSNSNSNSQFNPHFPFFQNTKHVGGWGSPVCCFPPCGVPPRGVWGLCPLRSSVDAFSMMPPRPLPTAGCSEPDSSWQSAAARPGTTLSVPAPGRPPGHRQNTLYRISIAHHTAQCTVFTLHTATALEYQRPTLPAAEAENGISLSLSLTRSLSSR